MSPAPLPAGLIAAPHLPLYRSGATAFERVPALAEHLRATGVKGVFINGTTGEGLCQSLPERMAGAEAWAKAKGDLHAILNLGAQSQADMVALAEHAAGLDLDGVAVVAPSFHRPRSVEDLVEMVLPVADAAGKPLWLYHIPALTHVGLDGIEVCQRLLQRCPTFAGVKFTVADLLQLQAMLEAAADGGWQVAWGCDELMLPALAMGARSFMGSTYNYAAPAYLRLMDAFERGDHEAARRVSRQVQPLLDLLVERGPVRVGKTLVAAWGIDLGPPRPPERPFTEDERDTLLADAARLELLTDAPFAPSA
jgi:N-acetylneuraminate lyase